MLNPDELAAIRERDAQGIYETVGHANATYRITAFDRRALLRHVAELEARLAACIDHLKKDWEFFAFDMGPGCEDAVRVEDFLTSIGHPRPAESDAARSGA